MELMLRNSLVEDIKRPLEKKQSQKVFSIKPLNTLSKHPQILKQDLIQLLESLPKPMEGRNEVKSIVGDALDFIYRQFDMKQYHQNIKQMNIILEHCFKNFSSSSNGTKLVNMDDLSLHERKATLHHTLLSNPSKNNKRELLNELDSIRMLQSAKHLIQVNQEKLIRASLHSGIQIVNISGNIALLLQLENRSIAIMKDLATKSVYAIQAVEIAVQTGRNKADQPDSPDWIKKVFDANESVSKRMERQMNTANSIVDLFESLSEKDRIRSLDERRKIKMVDHLIVATGANLKKFKQSNGKRFEQRKLLLEAIKRSV